MSKRRVITAADSSGLFIVACREAEIEPTTRQWKKWRNKTGLAWKEAKRRGRV